MATPSVQHSYHEKRQGRTVDARVDCEVRAVGSDRIFKEDVEKLLVPVKVQIVGEGRTLHTRERFLIGSERLV
jgi:hypothetical protein